MTEDMLARRAVACRGFRWVRGMLRHDGYRYIGSGVWARWSDTAAVVTALHMPEQYPDLTDAPTVGGLLALVREAWGQDDMGASRYKERWCVEFTPQEAQNYAFYGASEAEALVAALEAAP